MSARDKFHDAVRHALEKEGWTITHDPLYLFYDQTSRIYIDLAAEKLITAEKENRKIAVEVKTFLSESPLSDFHTAIGQFLNYRVALMDKDADRQLYLAAPLATYTAFLESGLPKRSIEVYDITLLVYDPHSEEIVLWTK